MGRRWTKTRRWFPGSVQAVVGEATGLGDGKHVLCIIHRGTGPVAVDAISVR